MRKSWVFRQLGKYFGRFILHILKYLPAVYGTVMHNLTFEHTLVEMVVSGANFYSFMRSEETRYTFQFATNALSDHRYRHLCVGPKNTNAIGQIRV